MLANRNSGSKKKTMTPSERNAAYLGALREAGGKRSSYNFKPEVVEAIALLKAANQFTSETIVVSQALIEAAAKLKKR